MDKTSNTGVESALEWLFANSGPAGADVIEGGDTAAATPSQSTESTGKSLDDETSAESGAEAKSLKCEEW